MQDYVKDLGVRVHTLGPPESVLSAQASRGFAFVSEAACETFLESKGLELPASEEDAEDRKTTLTIACIAAIKPDMKAEEVSKTINTAFLAENPDCYATLPVDEDMLSDVVDKGEAKKLAEYTLSVEKSKAKKAFVMQTRDKCVRKLFKGSPPPKYSAAQKRPPRWLPEQDKGTTSVILDWITKHCAPEVAIQVDDYNGRWRVIAPTLEWRSVSWTKRGHEKAALEAIHQSWLYQKDWDDREAPFSLSDLAKRFLD